MKQPSLTIIMPAYNEATAIRGAYESVSRVMRDANISDYEIIIATNTARDGSHDGTPTIADEIAHADSRVIHLFHDFYAGLGFKYRDAVAKATKEYITWIPGDNDTVASSFLAIAQQIGTEPVTIVYTANPNARPGYIRNVSSGFVLLCNMLFGLKLPYYNGINVFPRTLLQQVPMSADNPAFMAEIVIYLVKSGVRYRLMPQEIKDTPQPGKTFRFRSVVEVLQTLSRLWWNINIRRVRITIPSAWQRQ